MTYTLFTLNGTPQTVDSAVFGEMPHRALALKYNDEVSGAEWITDSDELERLRLEDAPLAMVLPHTVLVTDDAGWRDNCDDFEATFFGGHSGLYVHPAKGGASPVGEVRFAWSGDAVALLLQLETTGDWTSDGEERRPTYDLKYTEAGR